MDTKELRLLMEIQDQEYPCDKKDSELRAVWISSFFRGRPIRALHIKKVKAFKKIIKKTVINSEGKFEKVVKNRVEPNKTYRFTRH